MSAPLDTGADASRFMQIGIDRGTTGVERLAVLNRARDDRALEAWRPEGGGVVALATCHRLEWYVEGGETAGALRAFEAWLPGAAASETRVRMGRSAAAHLMRVTAGLESAVLGEDQILAQAREAYRRACAAGRSGPLLHRVFHAAFRAGRRVRAETSLASGTRSLAGAAVAAIHRRFGGLTDRTVMVLGAGEMARLAVRLLADRRVGHLVVCNRTAAHAARLAGAHGGDTTPWEWRLGRLATVDAVVAATSSALPVVDAEALAIAARGRHAPLVIADLGMPPNVAADAPAPIERLDVEQLGALLREEEGRRAAAVAEAEAIVEEEVTAWAAWRAARRVDRISACAAAL